MQEAPIVVLRRSKCCLEALGHEARDTYDAQKRELVRENVDVIFATSPSIAAEFGVLLPDSNGDSRVGASINAIVSQRWDWGTAHLNMAAELTRDQRADVFTDLIVEGPSKWVVRPVAEFFYEEEFGRAHTLSGLVGAIWQVNDKLSFDIGFRHAVTNGSNVNEIRAGLTVGFMSPFGRPDHKR